MIPETCRSNLSERTAESASLVCWPKRAVGAPYLVQSLNLSGDLGSPFIYYFSFAESRGTSHYRPQATISIIADEAVLRSGRFAEKRWRRTLAPDLFPLLSSSMAPWPPVKIHSHSPFSNSLAIVSRQISKFEN